MKNDKFQENLSRPGIIDAKARYRATARRLRNTRVEDRYAGGEQLQLKSRPLFLHISVTYTTRTCITP